MSAAIFFAAFLCSFFGDQSWGREVGGEIEGLELFDVVDLDLSAFDEQTKGVLGLGLNIAASKAVSSVRRVKVQIAGVERTLELRPYSVRSSDFRILVQRGDGELHEFEAPAAGTYRGVVENDPNSRVTASIINGGLRANIALSDGESWYLQPVSELLESTMSPSIHVLYRRGDVARPEGICMAIGTGGASGHSAEIGASILGEPVVLAAESLLSLCEIAIDADYEYYQLNGSSVSSTVGDIEDIINEVCDIYEQNVGVTFTITTIIVRSDPNDPYTSSEPYTVLYEFVDHWRTNQTGITRDTAHLFTGKDVDGSIIGVAYLSAICWDRWGYAFSQSRYTSFMPYRVELTAHEIGHNFGGTHCDADADCKIMCPWIGNCAHIVDEFGSRAAGEITSLVDSNSARCLDSQTAYTISGYARNSEGWAVSGATISFSNGEGTAITANNGYYSQLVASGWSGTATPSKGYYTFAPSSRSYSNLAASASNEDYSGTRSAGEHFAEQFFLSTDKFDLANKSIMFTPTGGGSSYASCLRGITQLPTGSSGGTELSTYAYSSDSVALTAPNTVSIFGSSFSTFYVGSSGYITFTEPDTDYLESFTDHFDTLRVSVLFDYGDPNQSGTISWKELSDRVAVTWNNVDDGYGNTSTFQAVMYFDGRIELSWLAVGVQDGIVGLSAGLGLPAGFEESDLSGCGRCVVYVDGATGNDALGLGSESQPYRTLGRALQAASGQKIVIGQGNYAENLTINTPYRIEAQDGIVRIGN